MNKLWNCLRHNADDLKAQVETIESESGKTRVDVITLPEGIYWPTEQSSHLFVRQCTKDLYDIVMSCNTRPKKGALVLGNSGIGKHDAVITLTREQGSSGSYTTVYIGWLLMKRHETSQSYLNRFQ